MKKIIALMVTAVLLTWSCSDTITESTSSKTYEPEQISRISDNELSVSKTIDGSQGGSITVNTAFVNQSNDTINLSASLTIESLSFDGVQVIQMIPDFSNASIKFFPEMHFTKPLKLNLSFEKIDVEAMGFDANSKADFVYIHDSGEIEAVPYSSCSVNGLNKYLRVTGAKLSHFSRYAFIK